MTDWRYSYFTMMPAYQAMVLRKFNEFLQRRMVAWSDRPILWSVALKRIMAEEEIRLTHEIRDAVVMKLGIKIFGEKASNIQKLYPDTKLLVFCKEPWKLLSMNAAALNENLLYVLAKWRDEYVIVAEQRLGEL